MRNNTDPDNNVLVIFCDACDRPITEFENAVAVGSPWKASLDDGDDVSQIKHYCGGSCRQKMLEGREQELWWDELRLHLETLSRSWE